MKLIWGSSWWRAWLPSPGNTGGGRQESLLQELGCQAGGPRKAVQCQEGGTETYNQKQHPLSKLSLLWRGCKATSWMQTKQALNWCWKWTGIYTSLHVVCGYVADTQGLVLHPKMGRMEEHVLIFCEAENYFSVFSFEEWSHRPAFHILETSALFWCLSQD